MWWLITGLIIGAAVLWLVTWMRSRNTQLPWYFWVIGGVGIVLLLLTIQSYFATIAEWEPAAANLSLLVLGLPAIILLAAAGLLGAKKLRAG